MTIKEITDLRKVGKIEEALQGAENEFAKNANRFTASALFWCLYEKTKRQADAETVERMEHLYHDHCEGDEVMQSSLAKVQLRLNPHYAMVKNAVEQAKAGGDVRALYQQIYALHAQGELGIELFSDLGWIIYYALKATPLGDANRRKVLLHQYLQLNLERPSILHSLILGEAVKVEQNTPLQFRICDFMRMWGLENLRDDDWAEYRTADGKTLPSLVEKLIGVYSKELITDRITAPADFAELVDKALPKYPNSQNMPYFKARVLLSQGRREEALEYYRDLIIKFPIKTYLWNQAAELVDDSETKIALLCKALTYGTGDEFLVKIRLRLAALLIAKGLLGNAKTELERYRQTYQANGWNPKTEFYQLYNQVMQAADADNGTLYQEYSRRADEFIYSALPTIEAVKVSDKMVDDRMHPGRKFTLWTLRSDKTTLHLKRPDRYGLDRRTANGAAFSVKVLNDKIVWIQPLAQVPNVEWLKTVEGEVRLRTDRNGRPYAIIGGAYVNHTLLANTSEGQRLRLLAIRQEDGRWSALSRL